MQEPSVWLCCVCWFFTVDIEQPLVLLSLTTQLCLLLVVHWVITWFSCSYLLKPAMLAYSFCKAQLRSILLLLWGNIISPVYVIDRHFHLKWIQRVPLFGSLLWSGYSLVCVYTVYKSLYCTVLLYQYYSFSVLGTDITFLCSAQCTVPYSGPTGVAYHEEISGPPLWVDCNWYPTVQHCYLTVSLRRVLPLRASP